MKRWWWRRTIGAQVAAGLILAAALLCIDLLWRYFTGRFVSLIEYATTKVETPRWLLLIGGLLALILATLGSSIVLRRLPRPTPSSPARATASVLPDARLKTFFYAWADPPGNTAVEVLNRLCVLLGDRPTQADRYVAILIRRSVIDTQRQVRTHVMDALNSLEEGRSHAFAAGEDQRLLCQYYEVYQALATWIHQAAGLLKLDFTGDQEYIRWRKIDEDFLNKLRECITQPEYHILANGVRGTGWGESVRPL